jgi:peptide deformylase
MVENVETLKVIHWPDPRLKKPALPVKPDEFGEGLRALISRMFILMREDKGVGLAAPQVGVLKRVFVINPTGKEGDDQVYINPLLSDPEGSESGEEGCLSIPGVKAEILRDLKLTITAQDLDGKTFTQTEEGYVARIWQHEFDHLNGTLLIDRMGAVARMQARKKLRDLEEKWEAAHPPAPKKTKGR